MRNLYLAALLVIALFIWTRTYQITESLHFFNDIGRDFLVLWQWRETGKPPLLGPQTSALPFNQSAIYFYLLFPFYLITGGSVYASLIAYLVIYVLAFALGLYLLRPYPRLEKSLLLVFLLMTVHPEYIIQGRFIWNPSFVSVSLAVAFYSLVVYFEQKSTRYLLLYVSAFAVSLATAFSYSAAPALLAFILYALYRRRQSIWRYLNAVMISLGIVNLPTLVFELRHQFFLTKSLLFGEAAVQAGNVFATRFTRLLSLSLSIHWGYVLAILALLAYFVYRSYQRENNRFLLAAGLLFLTTFILTIFAPVSIHSHYIFPFLTFLFIMISFLQARYIYVVAVVFYLIFLPAALRLQIFGPARHTIKELQECAAAFCATQTEPLFVSNQSSHHPYHNAMEWQYLLSQAGCQLRDVATAPESATTMAVVLDDDVYEHGKTSFYELSQFGQSQESSRFHCKENLEIVVLDKTGKP